MTLLESRTDRSRNRKLLLTACLGIGCGLQGWRFSQYGVAAPIPSFGLAWLLLGHVVLGLSVGAVCRFPRWWTLGAVLGLVFSIPFVLGALALGLRWVPYGVVAISAGLGIAL